MRAAWQLLLRAGALLLACLMPVPAMAADCVVLLHGLARSPQSLSVIEEVLKRRGLRVINAGYPSTKEPLEVLVGHVGQAVEACGSAPVDVITHSMGGILLQLWAAQEDNARRIARAVMLAPPNGGSEIVDAFGDQAWFAWMNGPAGLRLGTDAEGVAASLPRPEFEFAVIAGSDSLNPVTSMLIPGADDGKVSVAHTKAPGMAAHLVLPVTHTWMMNDPRVIRQALAFLQEGAFAPPATWGEAFAELMRGAPAR